MTMNMSMSATMNAGIAGLAANATRLATISDNIANSGTNGYRRVQTSFHSMVLGEAAGSRGTYTAGGVRTTTMRVIDQGGQIASTSNSTDLAINGRGFLPVTSLQGARQAQGDMPFMLATTGSFRFDADGYLRDTADMVLLGVPANADGSIPPFSPNSIDGLQPVRMTETQHAPLATSQINLQLNLPASATLPDADPVNNDLSVEYVDNTGLRRNLDVTFAPNITPPEHSNSWTLEIRAPGDDVPIAEYELTFGNGSDDGGLLVSVVEAGGSPAYDPATGAVLLDLDGQEIAFGLGQLLDPAGMTQHSTAFNPYQIEHNGFAKSDLLGVKVTEDGLVQAIYDQGQVRTLYRVPLVDVPNPNGLQSLNDQVYRITTESGNFLMWTPGEGPTGTILGNALEQSATDIAEELTGLIQTQRAYSSNAKVIQTVDEMLQETTNLKR
ncbi:flagellar hook protein FlgE [Rhabdonatronobacter sediminivivens]|nr:flagellar hook-basal body complex protein [Rhabdonatronobacter sediminivivens]